MAHTQILRDMALFVEVGRRKSFTKAAEALGMPISSLSRRITSFEAVLGVRLIDRTTRRLELTVYGESYLAEATRIVEAATRSFDELVAQAKGPAGTLRIAVPPDAWLARRLAGVLAGFSQSHKQIRLDVDPRAGAIDLSGERYDLAIVLDAPSDASLIARKATEVEVGLYAAPSYLRGAPPLRAPFDLAAHQAVHAGSGESESWCLLGQTAVETVSVSGAISCRNPELGRSLALDGVGIAAAPHSAVEEDVTAGRLKRVLPDWRLPPVPVYLVTTSRLIPARARCFIDYAARRLPTALASEPRPLIPADVPASGPAAKAADPVLGAR